MSNYTMAIGATHFALSNFRLYGFQRVRVASHIRNICDFRTAYVIKLKYTTIVIATINALRLI